MLPTPHVLDLIRNLNTNATLTPSPKRQFVEAHKNKWAVIRQENLGTKKGTINHIESVHDDVEHIKPDMLTRQHIILPVSDEMYKNPTFTGHENHI